MGVGCYAAACKSGDDLVRLKLTWGLVRGYRYIDVSYWGTIGQFSSGSSINADVDVEVLQMKIGSEGRSGSFSMFRS